MLIVEHAKFTKFHSLYDVLIQSNQPLALMTLFTSQQFVRAFLGSISGLVGNELLLSASSENQLLLIS